MSGDLIEPADQPTAVVSSGTIVRRMDRLAEDVEQVLAPLLAAADLPPAVASHGIDEHAYGLDNHLIKATLADGREVLLRQSAVLLRSPRRRVDFLRQNGVPLPVLHAADDNGHALWEFVPGQPLADLVELGRADDRVWQRVGEAYAAVHSVRFPAPLQGLIGVDSLELRPIDPVDQLHDDLESAGRWAAEHLREATVALDRVAVFIEAHTAEIRSGVSAVTHGDTNLLNIIASEHAVQLIDWDFPAVRYPLAELSALDEHAYLHGLDGLPDAFFAGYGAVSAELLLAYRIVGCIGWLSGDDWTTWQSDLNLPVEARGRLQRWHHLLVEWAKTTPSLSAVLV